MNVSKTSFSFMVIVCLVWLLFVPNTGIAEISHLTILHTSEHRGHFAKFVWQGTPDVGGMAARSTLVNIVRAEVEQAGGHVLLLSAGGIKIGTPESDILHAEPDFRLMQMLGYDAIAPDVHEFNNSHEVLLQQQAWTECPFLSANLVSKTTGEPIVDPYMITTVDGFKVAIFGLTSEDTPNIIIRYRTDVESRNAIDIARTLVPTLRQEADLVIALTNIEFDASRSPGNVQIARAVPGIDVIVGINQILEQPAVVGDTLIVQAGDYGLYVGRLDLTIDTEAEQTISDVTYTLIPVNVKQEVIYQGKSYYQYVGTGYVEDPVVLEVVNSYLTQADEILSQPVGETMVTLVGDRTVTRSQETNLANLVTDGMRAKTGAEIAMINAGTIQTNADIPPGPLTYRDIVDILPWRTTLVLLDMTGKQVMEVLRHVATFPPGSGEFLHVSGLTWTNNKGIAKDVLVGGVSIELDRIYKVVTTNFLADGGDGHTTFKELPQWNTGFVDSSVLQEYIKNAGKVAPKVEGRVKIIE